MISNYLLEHIVKAVFPPAFRIVCPQTRMTGVYLRAVSFPGPLCAGEKVCRSRGYIRVSKSITNNVIWLLVNENGFENKLRVHLAYNIQGYGVSETDSVFASAISLPIPSSASSLK